MYFFFFIFTPYVAHTSILYHINKMILYSTWQNKDNAYWLLFNTMNTMFFLFWFGKIAAERYAF